jgi:hypothetical protein
MESTQSTHLSEPHWCELHLYHEVAHPRHSSCCYHMVKTWAAGESVEKNRASRRCSHGAALKVVEVTVQQGWKMYMRNDCIGKCTRRTLESIDRQTSHPSFPQIKTCPMSLEQILHSPYTLPIHLFVGGRTQPPRQHCIWCWRAHFTNGNFGGRDLLKVVTRTRWADNMNIESFIQQFILSILDPHFLTNTYPGGNAIEPFTSA